MWPVFSCPCCPPHPFCCFRLPSFSAVSPRAYQWLLNHKLLGPYIRDFRESRAIPLRAKILALSLLWLTSLHCIFLMFDALWLKAMMLAVAVGVTLYLCSLKTKRK